MSSVALGVGAGTFAYMKTLGPTVGRALVRNAGRLTYLFASEEAEALLMFGPLLVV